MSERVICELQRIDESVPIPSYAHEADNGLDLCSAEDKTIMPGERLRLRLGLFLEVPSGYRAVLQSRSGLAAQQGVAVFDAPSPVALAQGEELTVLLANYDLHTPCHIHKGDRVAQLVIECIPSFSFRVVDSLEETDRGAGGFGSSGH